MGKKILTLAAAMVVFILFTVVSVSAQPINGHFDTGDYTGWTVLLPTTGDPWVKVLTSWDSDQGTHYVSPEGKYMAVLKTDGPGSYTTVTQGITMSAGETMKGYAAFDARDYMPYNDNGYVKILDSSNNVLATAWYSDVSTLGNYGDGPWTLWQWTAPTAGTYTVQFGNSNEGDDGVDSFALFSGVSTTGTSIPEFPSIAVPVAAILGLVIICGRKKNVVK